MVTFTAKYVSGTSVVIVLMSSLVDKYHISFMVHHFSINLSAAYYVKVMTKVQEKGDEFVKNENDRLGRMMEGGAVSSKKSDEFTKRRNVLNKFEL
jgi:hypothetical protein